jgi:GntR family transcriptional repressor for pyruvate dehydrogenase complex
MNERLQSERLYELIVRRLEQRIIAGELKEGQRLPPERDLAKTFGVSRTAVREAMKVLAQSGLVEMRHGSGTFVRNHLQTCLRHSIDLISKLGRASDAIEMREILEPEVAALAARRASDDDLRILRESVRAMETADDPEAMFQAELSFHQALARSTGNVLFMGLLDPVDGLLHEMRERIHHKFGSISRNRLDRIRFLHRKTLEALLLRDPAAARAAMHRHFANRRREWEIHSRKERSARIRREPRVKGKRHQLSLTKT